MTSFDSLTEPTAKPVLGENEARYKLLTGPLCQFAWTTDHEGNIDSCNRHFLDYLGLTLEQVQAGRAFEFVHPDDFPGLQHKAEQSRATGEAFEHEYRVRRASDGEYRWHFAHVEPLADAERRQRWLGVAIDVTACKQSERELRDNNGLPVHIAGVVIDTAERNRAEEVRNSLAAIVDSSDDAIISKDLNGIVTSWNTAATQLFGYRPEEIIGKSILTIIPPELQSEEPRILETLRSGRKVDHYETVRVRKDGKQVHVSLTISPVRDASGRIVGASKIAHDIGERLRMQEAIVESEKLAATGRMAAAIAHEINNPLEAVTNLAYLLSTDPSLSDSAKKYANLLLEEINRVSQVAKQSLGFFRDSKKPSVFDVSELLDSAVNLYKPALKNRGIKLERSYTGSCQVFGSSAEIRQVFANLVRNAIDAVDPGGVIQLRVRTTHSGMRRVLVADNGHGIAKETRARLFQPFVTSKGTAGNGLGLWVSQGIVKKHRGKIRVKTCDIPGRSGTVFSVVLPAWNPAVPAPEPEEENQQSEELAS